MQQTLFQTACSGGRYTVFAALFLFMACPGFGQESGPQDTSATQPQAQGEDRIRRLGDSLSVAAEEEWVPKLEVDVTRQRVTVLLDEAQARIADGRVALPRNESAADVYLEILELLPEEPAALQGLLDATDAVAAQAAEAIASGDSGRAETLIARLAELAPDHPQLAQLRGTTERTARISALRAAAASAEANGQFDGDDGAIARYRNLLAAAPGDVDAKAALARIAADAQAAAAAAPDLASALAQAALAVLAGGPDTSGALIDAAEDRIAEMVSGTDPEQARPLLDQLGAVAPDRAAALSGTLKRALVLARFPLNARVQPDASGPALIVIEPPGGARIALAETETTVAAFRHFVDATGYRTDAERNGSSIVFVAEDANFGRRDGVTWREDYLGEPARPDDPVLHVSWNDATAYTEWLSGQGDAIYRLPTRAEFGFAQAAGADTTYWWGNGSPDVPVENLAGLRDVFSDGTQWTAGFGGYNDGFWGPAPVASFPANGWGFHDLAGNVMEWVADCYDEDCELRTLCGASWNSKPDNAQAGARARARETDQSAFVGFRVVREIQI